MFSARTARVGLPGADQFIQAVLKAFESAICCCIGGALTEALVVVLFEERTVAEYGIE